MITMIIRGEWMANLRFSSVLCFTVTLLWCWFYNTQLKCPLKENPVYWAYLKNIIYVKPLNFSSSRFWIIIVLSSSWVLVSQLAPIKILPWRKKKTIIMILMMMIKHVKSSKCRWLKLFFSLQWVHTRRDESRRLLPGEYLLWVFHVKIGYHKYSLQVWEPKKRKIQVFANTGL